MTIVHDGNNSSNGGVVDAPIKAHDLASVQVPTPRTVIRGESFSTHPNKTPESYRDVFKSSSATPPYSAITDWLNCTFPLSDSQEDINRFFRRLIDIVGDSFAPLTSRGYGLHGWSHSYKFGDTGGLFAIGGQHGTAYVSLSGEACTLIPHDAWSKLIDLFENQYHARITRWDGAVDDYSGRHSVDMAVMLYKSGQFNSGGNKPSCGQHGNWIDHDGTGRTFVIGKRKNGKLLRIYEKGKQLGDPTSPWVRWELELHNRDRVIPWEVLLNPGGYVAGAFKCMSWVGEEASRIKTTQKTIKAGYDKLTYCARQSYGRLINTMLETEGSPEKVVNMLRRDGIPSRLDVPIPPEMLANKVEK